MTDRELAACPLLPCPFCGSAAEIRGEHYTAIRCPNDQCIISTRDPVPFNFYGHRADAIAAWNRRAAAGEVVDMWREAFRHRVFNENIRQGAPITVAHTCACTAVEQVEAGIRAAMEKERAKP